MFQNLLLKKMCYMFFAIISGFVITCLPAQACNNILAPNIFLADLSLKMIGSLNDNHEKIKDNPTVARRLIEDILIPHADFYMASKNVLGQDWKKLTKEQKKKFVPTFRIFLIRTSSVILAEYLATRNEKIKNDVIKFDENYVVNKNKAKVKSKVLSDSAKIYPVNYKLRCVKSSWRIYDVVLDGVSIIKQYHGQFKIRIEQDGYDSLIAFLKYKNNVMLASGTNASNVYDVQ